MSPQVFSDIGKALGTDYFHIRDELTAAELDFLERARHFVDEEVLPVIGDHWERAEFPWDLVRRLGELGLVGDGIEGYGCPEMSPLAAGLVTMEIIRGDGSLGTFLGVQGGLAMRSITLLGSEEQKQRWLPAMARVEKLGAFALTEPDHGSDSIALETSARRDGDDRNEVDRSDERPIYDGRELQRDAHRVDALPRDEHGPEPLQQPAHR